MSEVVSKDKITGLLLEFAERSVGAVGAFCLEADVVPIWHPCSQQIFIALSEYGGAKLVEAMMEERAPECPTLGNVPAQVEASLLTQDELFSSVVATGVEFVLVVALPKDQVSEESYHFQILYNTKQLIRALGLLTFASRIAWTEQFPT